MAYTVYKHTNKINGKVYDTIKIAAEDTGANQFKISDVCRGKREKTGGLKWKYAVQ